MPHMKQVFSMCALVAAYSREIPPGFGRKGSSVGHRAVRARLLAAQLSKGVENDTKDDVEEDDVDDQKEGDVVDVGEVEQPRLILGLPLLRHLFTADGVRQAQVAARCRATLPRAASNTSHGPPVVSDLAMVTKQRVGYSHTPWSNLLLRSQVILSGPPSTTQATTA